MVEKVIKLQRFAVIRLDALAYAEASRVLWKAAEEHHGADWPAVEKFYRVEHYHYSCAERSTSVLLSDAENAVIING